jgi:hypothetical protein
VVAACVAVAALSVVLFPTAMGFDPWAWVVWGREVGRLELDTTGGPSWKPLPVLVTTALAPAGELAPDLWLVVARSSGLLLACGVFRLAARLVGGRAGPAAGAIAVVALVLTPDPEPRLLRTILEGHTAPVAAALAVWAIDRFLAGSPRTALLLGSAMALLRPEAWPLLIVASLWSWRREPGTRPITVAALVLVPLCWFGGDWWGSGDPLHGATAAQVVAGDALERWRAAVTAVAEMAVVPVWAGAAVAVAVAARRRRAAPVVIAAGSAVWCATVVGMSVVLGYAAISRFLLPAAAVLCVLGGVGAVEAVRIATPAVGRAVAIGALLVVAGPFVLVRAAGVGGVLHEVDARAALADDLAASIERAGGRDAVLGCGAVNVDGSSLLRPAHAWELDVPLDRIGDDVLGRGVSWVVAGGPEDVELTAADPRRVQALTRTGAWAVFAVGCE